MAGAVQGPNHVRRFSLQSVVEYPLKASDSIDKDSSIIRDKAVLSTEQRLTFVVNSSTLKPALRADLPPGQSSPQELSTFQAIVFVNEKPIGKLVDPSLRFEDHSQDNITTSSLVETVQVAHLVYDKWQAAFPNSKSSCGTVQPLCIPVHEHFRTAQIRIQLIGRQFGQPVALPAYLVSGRKLCASLVTQRQLLDYIKQQHYRFTEGCKDVFLEAPAGAKQTEYCWQCGSIVKGCSFTFNIKDQPAWINQVEVRVPVSAHSPLDGCDVQPQSTLAASVAPSAPSIGPAQQHIHSSVLWRPMATNLAVNVTAPEQRPHRYATPLYPSELPSAPSQAPSLSVAAWQAVSKVGDGDLCHTDLPAPELLRHPRSSFDHLGAFDEKLDNVVSGSKAASTTALVKTKASGVGSGASQPSGCCAGGSGNPGDGDGSDNSSNRRADDGSSSSSSNGTGGRKGGRQCSGGAGGNEDEDEFREDRQQCGPGRAIDETVNEVHDETDAESAAEGTSSLTDHNENIELQPSTSIEGNQASDRIPIRMQHPTSNRKPETQVQIPDLNSMISLGNEQQPAVTPSLRLHEVTPDFLQPHPSTMYPKQYNNGRYPPKAVNQVNGRHRIPSTMPAETVAANGFSDAAVLERLLAESPIAFLTHNREPENGFGDGGSTSSDEGSVVDGTGAVASGDAHAAGLVSSSDSTGQANAALVDVFDSTYDPMSKRKYRLTNPGRTDQARKQPSRTPNGTMVPSHSSKTAVHNRRQQRIDQDAATSSHYSRAEALPIHSAPPEVQPVPSRDPRGMSDLERFLEQATPYLKLNPANPDLINTLCLEDVWRFYHEPSLYGREVLTYGGQRGTSFSYFVPYLSAIQLFVPALPGDPGTDKLYGCDHPEWHKYMHMVYEFFDRDPPFNRPPMYVRMEMLSNEKQQDGLDSQVLLRQRIKELHPCSWYAVAWYPVYRIPDAPLTARFLTFHSFAPLITRRNFPPAVDSIPLQVSGLKWYNMMNDRWFENLSESTTRNEAALEEGGSRGLRKNYTQSIIDPEWQHHLEELQNTADRLARGVGLRVLGKMGSESVELYHPDWQFFNGRS